MTPIIEQLLAAWDALPVGDHSIDQVQKWLNGAQLKEAVTAARKALTTPAPGRDALRERIIASIRDVFGLLEMGGSNEPSYLTDAIAHFRDDDDIGPALEMISSAAESCADAILSALPVAPVVDEAAIRAAAFDEASGIAKAMAAEILTRAESHNPDGRIFATLKANSELVGSVASAIIARGGAA